MSKVLNTVKRIYYPLLRHQKTTLLELSKAGESSDFFTREDHDALNGIINLIDRLQDAVVEDGIKTEKEVFGK
jgi:hypothetical protein